MNLIPNSAPNNPTIERFVEEDQNILVSSKSNKEKN